VPPAVNEALEAQKKGTIVRFSLTLTVLAVALCASAEAQSPAKFPRHHDCYDPEFEAWAMQEIRPVIEENFAAVNAEDIERLMATHTSDCPDREAFRRESEQAFKDFDVYVRLLDLRWGGGSNASTGYKEGHRCSVIVTQHTRPANAKDGDYTAYRGNSALLPESELVWYTLQCRMEGGKWKIHMINGHVNPTTWEFFEAEQKEREKNNPKAKPSPAEEPVAAQGDAPQYSEPVPVRGSAGEAAKATR
jgi:hypothetical protein